jgi:hypothetical protein
MSKPEPIIQGSLFEDDYLIRSLGNIVRDAEYALTELVANAWDAGATSVNIDIPTDEGGIIALLLCAPLRSLPGKKTRMNCIPSIRWSRRRVGYSAPNLKRMSMRPT